MSILGVGFCSPLDCWVYALGTPVCPHGPNKAVCPPRAAIIPRQPSGPLGAVQGFASLVCGCPVCTMKHVSSGGAGAVPFLLLPQRLIVSSSRRLKFRSAHRACFCLIAPLQGSCLSPTQVPRSRSQSSVVVVVHVSWSAPSTVGAKQSWTRPFPKRNPSTPLTSLN